MKTQPKKTQNNTTMDAHTSVPTISLEVLYRKYSERILNFISTRIETREDAENISQDVWMKIMECGKEVNANSALSYLYRVATNLVNDFLRKMYVRAESRAEVARGYEETPVVTPAQEYEAFELAALEAHRVECLPSQRRIIYIMSRFEEKPVVDIATSLNLSFRTVENHLRMGRRDVRDYLTAIA